MVRDRLFRTKSELREALSKDIRDRKTARSEGRGTKGITQVIQQKKRILKSKKYWE